MTHELKKIIQAYKLAKEKGMKTVMATVVALEGSSYRRPGVRMLIRADGKMTGAVSGGCVEKEICRQADSVFKKETPKTMVYDGRYRLGCEGILCILIEPFQPNTHFLEIFANTLKSRQKFEVVSYFKKGDSVDQDFGSLFRFGKLELPLRSTFERLANLEVFEQEMEPCTRLLLLGSEHDAVQLCSYAALTGWEVIVVAHPSEEKSVTDFPGAQELLNVAPENLSVDGVDEYTAVMIMSHSYVKDLKYLIRLKDSRPAYLGLLGPSKRREKLLGEFMECCPEIHEGFYERINGPAGLNIGAETEQEIAIAILSEILSVMRNQHPILLKDKHGAIHS